METDIGYQGPLHKRNFRFGDGECINDPEYKIMVFDVREQDGELLVLLPPASELDSAIGTSKWMVRQATAEMFGRGGAGQIEIIGPDGRVAPKAIESTCGGGGASCGNSKLDW